MAYNSVIMGLRDTLFAIITFVIMAYNGVIMETRFADGTQARRTVLVVLEPE